MNFSLKSTIVFSILFTVFVPIAVFAAPVFVTDTTGTSAEGPAPLDPIFYFDPEQSIVNPLYFDNFARTTQVSDTSVIVIANATDPTLQEVFVTFLDASKTSTVYLSYTNNLIKNFTGGSPYFVDSFNSTQTVMLSENDFDIAALPNTACNIASQPKIAVTDSHVFVS